MTDHLGTPRITVDRTGSLAGVSRHDYLPFGEDLSVGRSTTPGYAVGDSARQKFAAKERDPETGLDFSEARYFASMQGRFTSVDPILTSVSKANPQTWNRYDYAHNNPLTLVDPNGLEAQESLEDLARRLREQRQNAPVAPTEGTAVTEVQLRPMIATVEQQGLIDQANVNAGQLSPDQLANATQARSDALAMVAPNADGSINPCQQGLITNFGAANPTSAIERMTTTGGAAHVNSDGLIIGGPQNVFNGTTTTESGIVDGNRVSVSADLLAHPKIRAVTAGSNVFLSATFGAQNRIERAWTIIHEQVVHVANGRNDTQFAPAGSSNPTQRIRCHQRYHSHKL